jgi:hypothetical protein
MLDPIITELADRVIKLKFRDQRKKLQHEILLTQNDAAMKGMGNSSALVELVYDHCVRDVELRASIVWETLKQVLLEWGVELSDTLSADLRNEVLKYQESIVFDASLSLDTVAKNAGFQSKPLSGALEHALAKAHADIDLFIISLHRQTKVSRDPAPIKESAQKFGDHYVDLTRIEQLKSLDSSSFDFAKLVRLCEELNTCYANECYFAVAMLVRAVLDHVPPVFDCKGFGEVANTSGKSFKDSMVHLENSSRKIADAHLHGQIRKRESLPNKTQVNFANDIDVLLLKSFGFSDSDSVSFLHSIRRRLRKGISRGEFPANSARSVERCTVPSARATVNSFAWIRVR